MANVKNNTKKNRKYCKSIIYIYTLLVWVSVCLYPINVKMANQIGPKKFMKDRPDVTPGKVYG